MSDCSVPLLVGWTCPLETERKMLEVWISGVSKSLIVPLILIPSYFIFNQSGHTTFFFNLFVNWLSLDAKELASVFLLQARIAGIMAADGCIRRSQWWGSTYRLPHSPVSLCVCVCGGGTAPSFIFQQLHSRKTWMQLVKKILL